MAAILLIIGLTLFFLGTLALAADLHERGKSRVLAWLPLACGPHVRQNWQDTWLAALSRVIGLALIVAAVGIAVARDPLLLEDPRRIFGVRHEPVLAGSQQAEMNSFVNSSDAILLAIRHDRNENLTGRIHGRSFVYDRVELIGNVLTVSQGEGFLPELEARIILRKPMENIKERRTVYVQPGDENPPVVHLSWRDREGVMQTEIIRRGYRMELQIAPLDRYQLKGFLQLILPDAFRSFLSGEFIAYTNHLRYHRGEVDLTFAHPDTLEYVAEQFLDTQYPEGAVRELVFSNTRIRSDRQKGSTQATLVLDSGRVERHRIELDRSDVGWAVRPGGVETTVLEQGNGRTSGITVVNQTGTSESGDADAGDPRGQRRVVDFADLSEYIGREVRTERLDGKVQGGRLKDVSDRELEVEASLGSGTVSYRVGKEQLARVMLANGDVLVLQHEQEGEDTAAADEDDGEAPPSESEVSTPRQSDEDEPAEGHLEALEGRRVTITDMQGETRTGRLKSVSGDEVTLTVKMGGGSVDYYYERGEIRSVSEAADSR